MGQNASLMNRTLCGDHDRGVVLENVLQDGMDLYYATKELKRDPEVIQTAVLQNPESAKFIISRVGCLIAVLANPKSLSYVPEEYQLEEDEILEHLIKSPLDYQKFEHYNKDKEFAIKFIQKYEPEGEAGDIIYDILDESLLDDREVVIELLRKQYEIPAKFRNDKRMVIANIEHADLEKKSKANLLPENLMEDSDVVLAALKKGIASPEEFSEEVVQSKNIVMYLLGTVGSGDVREFLKSQPREYLNDVGVALCALSHDRKRECFVMFSDQVRSVYEVCMLAIVDEKEPLRIFSSNLRYVRNPRSVSDLFRICGRAKDASPFSIGDLFRQVNHQLMLGEKEVMMIILQIPELYPYLERLPPELLNDEDICVQFVSHAQLKKKHYPMIYLLGHKTGALEAVKRWRCLRHLREDWQADEEVVIQAVRSSDAREFQHASEHQRGNKNVIREAMRCTVVSENQSNVNSIMEHVLGHIPRKEAWLQCLEDMDFVMEGLKKMPNMFAELPLEMKKNEEVIKKAVKFDRKMFLQVPREVREDKNFLIKHAAWIAKQKLFHELSVDMRSDKEVVHEIAKCWCERRNGDVIRFLRKDLPVSLREDFTFIKILEDM